MRAHQCCERARQELDRHELHGRDAEPATDALTLSTELGTQRVELAEDAFAAGEQLAAGLCERDPARGPLEELRTELVLELAHRLAHRWRSDVGELRAASEAGRD